MQKGREFSSQPLSHSLNLQNLQTYIYISRLLNAKQKGLRKTHNPLSLIVLYSIKKSYVNSFFYIFLNFFLKARPPNPSNSIVAGSGTTLTKDALAPLPND